MSSLLAATGLLVIGMLLFLIEAMIPSFGAIGVIGAVAMIGAVVMAFHTSAVAGIVFLIAGPVGAVLLFLTGLRLLPKTKIGKSFILEGPAREKEMTVDPGYKRLEGKEGVTQSVLRPAGIALIEDERVSVQTEGEVIEKNVRIKVVKVVGNKIFVERV